MQSPEFTGTGTEKMVSTFFSSVAFPVSRAGIGYSSDALSRCSASLSEEGLTLVTGTGSLAAGYFSHLCLGGNDMFNNLARRIVGAAVGLVLVLGYWTLKDKVLGGTSQTSVSDKVPAKVWEGGGTTLTIETESSDPATLRAFFESTEKHEGTPSRS